MARPKLNAISLEEIQSKSGSMHAHPLYNTWRGMVERCFSKTSRAYQRYGGKGISVHPAWVDKNRDVNHKRWSKGFCLFVDYIASELGPKPQDCSLDRIANTNGYVPGNLRWANLSLQKKNQTVANFSGCKYVYKHSKGGWTADFKYNGQRFYAGFFDTKEEAYAEVLAKRLEIIWPLALA